MEVRKPPFCKLLLLLIIILLVPNFTFGQSKKVEAPKKFSIELSVGYLHHGQLKSPVLHTFCFEGCVPQRQVGLGSSYSAVTGAWQFLPRLQLRLGFLSHTRRIEETLQGNLGGGIFTNELMQAYHGFQPSIQYDLISGKRISLYIDNGLALEWARDASRRDVDLAVSFTNKIGVRIQPIGERWAFTIHSLAFLPLDAFYKEDAFTGFESYLPFAVGAAAGALYRF